MVLLSKNIVDINFQRIGYLSFLFAIFSIIILAVHNQFLPPLMITWGLFWLFEFISRKGKISADENKTVLLLCCFLIFYFWFISGLFYSENKRIGILLVFRRLSFAVFPIILFSPGIEIKRRIHMLLKTFTLGTIAFLIFCFCYALFRSIVVENGSWIFNPMKPEEPWLNFFYGQELSFNQHHSYISMYSLMAMFISFELFTDKKINSRVRIFWLIAGLFLFISLYFLSSRAAYLATIFILPGYLLIKLGKKRVNAISIGAILFILICISSVYIYNQRVRIIFENPNDTASLNDERLGIWKSAINVIQKYPLIGVGTGDSFDKLENEFKLLGYTQGFYKNLNAHNQYLETLISSGVIGLFFFLVIFGVMIFYAIKDRNTLYGVFIIMMLIFFIFESMLERLAGVSFFSLFSFLLMHLKCPVQESLEK